MAITDDDNDKITRKKYSQAQVENTPPYQEHNLLPIFPKGEAVQLVEFEYKIKDNNRRKNPLNPEPPQFQKPVPRNLESRLKNSDPFKTMVMYALREHLRHGFPGCFPVPLKKRGVSPEDWKRFIEDICCIQAKLGKYKKLVALAILDMPRDFGLLLKYVKRLAGKAGNQNAQRAIEVWNEKFFNPRKIHIVLQTPDDLRERGGEDVPERIQRRPSWLDQAKYTDLSSEVCRMLIFDMNSWES